MSPLSSPASRARRRRGLAGVAAATAALTAAGLAVPAAASAQGPVPKVRTVVRHGALFVDGGRAADLITLRVPLDKQHLLTVDLGDDGTADASVLRTRFDRIVVRGNDGDDTIRIDQVNGVPFSDTTPTSLRGGRGNDTLLGGSGAEDLRGGPDNDTADGNVGADVADLGAGHDRFIWDPGDGSDIIEGRAGLDMMTFNGSGGNEHFVAEAFGDRLKFTRDLGNIVMDTDDVELVDLHALGGSDFTEVKDLTKTDVLAVGIDGAAALGGVGGDGINDTIDVVGTERSDQVTITGSAGAVQVAGLRPLVLTSNGDPSDALNVITLGGRDRVDASALAADTPHLGVLAGAGDDTVLGGAGTDTILADRGRDVVDGNRGDDDADLDQGEDTFIWDPGDGSDVVDGGPGYDVMTFNGSGADEIFSAFNLGNGVGFTRNVGNIFMNTSTLEQIDVNAAAGVDDLTVEDLTGTGLTAVTADLAGTIGTPGGDAAADKVTVKGTPGDDLITVAGGNNGFVHVGGLAATVDISNAEPTDSLTIAGNGGTDDVDSTGLIPGSILFTIT